MGILRGVPPHQGGKATSGRTSKREGSSRSEREELDKRAGARSRPRAGRDSVRDAKQPLAYQPPKTADPSHVGLSARQKRMSELESESEDEPGHGGGGYNNMSLQVRFSNNRRLRAPGLCPGRTV